MFIILPSFRMIKPDQNVLMDVLWAVTRPLITILTSFSLSLHIKILLSIISFGILIFCNVFNKAHCSGHSASPCQSDQTRTYRPGPRDTWIG